MGLEYRRHDCVNGECPRLLDLFVEWDSLQAHQMPLRFVQSLPYHKPSRVECHLSEGAIFISCTLVVSTLHLLRP